MLGGTYHFDIPGPSRTENFREEEISSYLQFAIHP